MSRLQHMASAAGIVATLSRQSQGAFLKYARFGYILGVA